MIINRFLLLFSILLLNSVVGKQINNYRDKLYINRYTISSKRLKENGHLVSKRMEFTMCTGQFEIHQNTIIRTGESQAIGGKYLQGIELHTLDECQQLCCKTEDCDVYIFEIKNNGYCYLFTCGPLDNFHCKFTHHANYTSAVLNPSFQLSHDGNSPITSTKPPLLSQINVPLSQQERELLNLKGIASNIHSNNNVQISSNMVPNSQNIAFSRNHPNKPTANNNVLEPNDFQSAQTVHNASSSTHCGRFQFLCHSGECIAVYNACNGIPQCEDGSDEGPECSEAKNRNLDMEMEQDKLSHVQETEANTNWKKSQTKIYKSDKSNSWGLQQYSINSNENQRNYKIPQDYVKQVQDEPSDGFASFVHNYIKSTVDPKLREHSHHESLPEDFSQSTIFEYSSDNKNKWNRKKVHSNTGQNEQTDFSPKEENNSIFAGRNREPPKSLIPHTTENHKFNLVKEKSKLYPENRPNESPDEYEVYIDETNSHIATSTKEPQKQKASRVQAELSSMKTLKQHTQNKDKKQQMQWILNKHEHITNAQSSHSDVPFVHEQYRLLRDHLALEMRDHDGYADRPGGAMLSLILGLLITAILAVMITCRLRSLKRRPIRQMMSTRNYDGSEEDEVIVNGMYL